MVAAAVGGRQQHYPSLVAAGKDCKQDHLIGAGCGVVSLPRKSTRTEKVMVDSNTTGRTIVLFATS